MHHHCFGHHRGVAYSSALSRQRVASLLDNSGVDRLWIAGAHVNWETGAFDGGHVSKTGKHTHCSAFVAAMAKRAGIYILRPPEHGQELLANAQATWLRTKGGSRGWYRLADEANAQAAADDGRFVVASYKNPHPTVPGHIAVVRPRGSVARWQIGESGPVIAMAGEHNFAHGSIQQGFGTRRWSIQFYACNLP